MSALYHRVRDGILGRIAAGELKVGDRLPPEAEYAAELGVSRATLRRAFADLEEARVLERRKRTGTQIVSAQPRPRFSMATGGLNELLSLDRKAVFAITGTCMVPPGDVPGTGQDVQDEGPDPWLEISGTRTLSANDTPFSVNRVYVPPRYVQVAPKLAGLQTSVFRAIGEAFGVSVGRVSQTVRARACPAEEAATMALANAAPVLEIEARLYTKAGDLLEISLAIFDPARFQIGTDVEIG